jgi:hypothetical protein
MAFSKFKVKNGISETISSETSPYTPIPVGLIIPFPAPAPPTGWLLCDGSSISSTSYPELTALIGTTLPNLQDTVIIGAGTGVGNGASGSGVISGGSALTTRTLLTNPVSSDVVPLPDFSHLHSLQSHTHTQTHAHTYPHSHPYSHSHNSAPHSHTLSSSDPHTHAVPYGSVASPGSLFSLRGGGSGASVPSTTTHTHSLGAASGGVTSSVTISVSSITTPAFSASPTTSTSAVPAPTDVTGSFGNTTPGATVSVKQPVLAVYFIIKY